MDTKIDVLYSREKNNDGGDQLEGIMANNFLFKKHRLSHAVFFSSWQTRLLKRNYRIRGFNL
jgi:hypothetical protein